MLIKLTLSLFSIKYCVSSRWLKVRTCVSKISNKIDKFVLNHSNLFCGPHLVRKTVCINVWCCRSIDANDIVCVASGRCVVCSISEWDRITTTKLLESMNSSLSIVLTLTVQVCTQKLNYTSIGLCVIRTPATDRARIWRSCHMQFKCVLLYRKILLDIIIIL